MASINWVAERAIPLLKMNPTMGASEMQKHLAICTEGLQALP